MQLGFYARLVWFTAIYFSGFAIAQDAESKISVTFELHAPELTDKTDVFIAGSLPSLGNWDPAKIQMSSTGDHRWTHKITITPNFPIEYKYTQGSWAIEAADSKGVALQNFAVQPNSDSTITDRVQYWTNGKSKPVLGQITGTVRYHRQMASNGLLPRDIIVWLPPGYSKSSTRHPVLYMNDGQNIVDPRTSLFGTDWQIDETLTRLITLNKVKPLIVVGVYNTSKRTSDYLPGPQGTKYASFVCEQLKPMIDKTYRTDPARESTAIGGSSAGGTCAFTMAWNHPDVFSKAICISPSFQFLRPDGTVAVDYLPEFSQSSRPTKTPFFYIANGGVGLELRLQPGIDAMLVEMKRKGMQINKDFYWRQYSNDRHNESAWAKRFPAVVEMLFAVD